MATNKKDEPDYKHSMFNRKERMDHRLTEAGLIQAGKFRELMRFWQAKKAQFTGRADGTETARRPVVTGETRHQNVGKVWPYG